MTEDTQTQLKWLNEGLDTLEIIIADLEKDVAKERTRSHQLFALLADALTALYKDIFGAEAYNTHNSCEKIGKLLSVTRGPSEAADDDIDPVAPLTETDVCEVEAPADVYEVVELIAAEDVPFNTVCAMEDPNERWTRRKNDDVLVERLKRRSKR